MWLLKRVGHGGLLSVHNQGGQETKVEGGPFFQCVKIDLVDYACFHWGLLLSITFDAQ